MKQEKKLSALAAGAVAMGLLLGASMAQAAVVFGTVITDKAIGITDLDVNGALYNVTFVEQATANETYGPLPGDFDFTTPDLAEDAVLAVNAALNAENAVLVGEDTGNDGFQNETFLIGYDTAVNPPPAAVVLGWTGSYGAEWVNGFSGQAVYIADERTYATFTEVSAIPVPAAVWLFGSGLLGLVGMARRKKTA